MIASTRASARLLAAHPQVSTRDGCRMQHELVIFGPSETISGLARIHANILWRLGEGAAIIEAAADQSHSE